MAQNIEQITGDELTEATSVNEDDYTLAVGATYDKKLKIRTLVDFILSAKPVAALTTTAKTIVGAINELNSKTLMGCGTAYDNGNAQNALHVDLDNPYGYANRAFTIDGSASETPSDLAWGIREVLYINNAAIIVRLTGVKSDGTTNVIWTNIYNYGQWSGWQEH